MASNHISSGPTWRSESFGSYVSLFDSALFSTVSDALAGILDTRSAKTLYIPYITVSVTCRVRGYVIADPDFFLLAIVLFLMFFSLKGSCL